MRPFLLGSLVLLASSLSAATPIAPVAPVYAEQTWDGIAPAAASNGTNTLVAWTNAFSAYSEAWSVCTRIMGVQSEGDCTGGFRAVVASDGKDYLVVRSIGTSRFNPNPYPNVFANVIGADGRRSPDRLLNTSRSGSSATDVAWNGHEWMVGIVAEAFGRIVFLDASLAEVRPALDLGSAYDVRFFERDGAWWCVQQTGDHTDVFPIDGGTSGFTIDGAATIAGSIAFIANGSTIRVATFDPQHGFGEPHAAFTDSRLIDAQPFGGGARVVLQSGTNVRGAFVDAAGNVTDSVTLFQQEGTAYASLLDDTIYFSTRRVATLNTERDVYAEPMQIAPLDIASATLVSAADRIAQYAPILATSGDHGVALWMQTEPDGTTATYRRSLDANGTPTGEIHKLPYVVNTSDADVMLRGDQLIVVWSDQFHVFAGIDDETFVLGNGMRPAVATGADGTFVVWIAGDGLVHGTPLDARVPDGFAILPSFAPQTTPVITAIEGGFLVLWSTSELQSVVISPAGAVRSATAIGEPQVPFLAGKLAVWPRSLFAYAPAGVPFEPFDPHWGRDWYPIAIEQLDADLYRVFLRRNEHVYTSDVSMSLAWVTGVTPLDYLGRFTDIRENAFASISGTPLAVVRNGRRVEITTPGSAKRRSSGLR